MQTVELLTNRQVTKVVAQIDALSDLWEQRNTRLPFFTLGAASYLDSSRVSTDRYYHKAARLNPLLLGHFSWLYDQVIAGLQQATGRVCRLADGQALPGFHIFMAHRQFLNPVASRHIDLQHQGLRWPEAQQVNLEEQTLSFTLALELPDSGAGLNIWPETNKAMMDRSLWSSFTGNGESAFVEYQPGQMVVHCGQLWHQIAPLRVFNPEDRRITLQGHAVLSCGDTYLLYW